MRKVGVLAIGAVLVGAGPALAQVTEEWYYPVETATAMAPKAGERKTVSAGEALATEFQERSTPAVILDEDAPLPAATKADVTLMKGETLIRIKSKAALKACAITQHLKSGPECLIDDDGDGAFDRGAKNYVTKARPLRGPRDTPATRRSNWVPRPAASKGHCCIKGLRQAAST